jgi:ubiquinol-cytochrome c reductase cytochrome c1 subunit
MPMIRFLFLVILSSKALLAGPGANPLPHHDWSFKGILGTFDRGELQRGFQVYKEVCSSCHGLKRVAYRNLRFLGFKEAEIKAIAANYQVTDGPNDEGEMFQRSARPSDNFVSPYPNEKAARAANNGASPPDLSLITKSRPGGANYVYSLLTGYTPPPPGMELDPNDTRHYNAYYPGYYISMAAPLSEGQVTYADGAQATVAQMAHDVVAFLSWAAEPELESRKELGFKVLFYVLFMTAIFYVVNRRVWKDVKKGA